MGVSPELLTSITKVRLSRPRGSPPLSVVLIPILTTRIRAAAANTTTAKWTDGFVLRRSGPALFQRAGSQLPHPGQLFRFHSRTDLSQPYFPACRADRSHFKHDRSLYAADNLGQPGCCRREPQVLLLERTLPGPVGTEVPGDLRNVLGFSCRCGRGHPAFRLISRSALHDPR